MKPLKDEDRWFKFFTKKQLLFVIIGLMLSAVIFPVFNAIGLRVIGIFLVEIIMTVMCLLAFLKIPFEKYLIGGGRYAHEILFRLFSKQLPANKIIFTKNYEDIEEE